MGVDGRVGDRQIQRVAERKLQPEARDLAGEGFEWMRSAITQIVADQLRRAPAELQSGMDTAARDRGHKPSRITDQKHASAAEWRDRSTSRNETAAAFDDAQGFSTQQARQARDELREIGLRSRLRGDAYLRHAMARDSPADIAGRDLAVGETMQETLIESLDRFTFDFGADEKASVAAQTEDLRHAGARTVRTDQIAGRKIEIRHTHAIGFELGGIQFTAIEKGGASALRFGRHPA